MKYVIFLNGQNDYIDHEDIINTSIDLNNHGFTGFAGIVAVMMDFNKKYEFIRENIVGAKLVVIDTNIIEVITSMLPIDNDLKKAKELLSFAYKIIKTIGIERPEVYIATSVAEEADDFSRQILYYITMSIFEGKHDNHIIDIIDTDLSVGQINQMIHTSEEKIIMDILNK